MKILIISILIFYCFACNTIQRKKAISITKKLKENCLVLNVTEIKNNEKIYFHFSSKTGSMNKTIYYKFDKKYNNSLPAKSINKKYKNPTKAEESKTTSNKVTKTEYHYYYEIEKESGANFLYLHYKNFNGNDLTIECYESSFIYIILIVVGVVFIVILIIVCVCVGRCCYAKKQRDIMQGYKTSFVDDNINSLY